MTEVHRYRVVKMLSEGGNRISYDPQGPEVVMADAYDKLKADRASCWAEFKVQRRQLDQLKAGNEKMLSFLAEVSRTSGDNWAVMAARNLLKEFGHD